MVDTYAPLIFLNTEITPPLPTIFTLITRASHIWYGQSPGFLVTPAPLNPNRTRKKFVLIRRAEFLCVRAQSELTGFWNRNLMIGETTLACA